MRIRSANVMPLKLYRSFNTGNSVQKYPIRAVHKEEDHHSYREIKDTVFVLSNSMYQYEPVNQSVNVSGFEVQHFVPYSLKKKKRWLLPDLLRDQIEEKSYCNEQIVDIVECEVDCYQRARPVSMDLKKANETTVCRVVGKNTFLNRHCRVKKRTWSDFLHLIYGDDELEEIEKLKPDMVFSFLHANPRSKIAKKHRRPWKPAFEYDWYFQEPPKLRVKMSKKKRNKHLSLDLNVQSDLDTIEEDPLDGEDHISHVHRQNDVQLSDFIINTPENKNHKLKTRKRRRLRSEHCAEQDRKARKVFCMQETEIKIEETATEVEETATEEAVDSTITDTTITEDPGASSLIRITFPTQQLLPSALLSQFGDRYMESGSLPRKFAIRLAPDNEDNSFLIFEEISANDSETVCDAFINLDVPEANQDCLIKLKSQIKDNNMDIASFVFSCGRHVTENFENSFQRRDTISIVVFHQKPLPLRQLQAHIQEEPMPRIQGPPSPTCFLPEAAVLSGTCDICFEDVARCCLLSCRHPFCTTCWERHIASSIRQGNLRLRCPASDCSEEVDAITALRFISLPLFSILMRQQATQALLIDPHVTLCSNINCRRPVRSVQLPDHDEVMDITCVCQNHFCFSCREEAHWPATCRMYRVFKEKMVELGDWKLHQSKMARVKGKSCPTCHRFIEKNGGCHSMVCICGENFCWQCSTPVADHDEFEARMCSRLYESEEAPVDVKRVDVVYSFCHPDSLRPRSYCAALKLRIDRLRHGNARRLDLPRIRALLYNEDLVKTKRHHFDRHHWNTVKLDAEEVARSYDSILRAAEFCHVICFAMNRTEASWAIVQREAVKLEQLASRIRKMTSREPIDCSQTRVGVIREALQLARKRVACIPSSQELSKSVVSRK